MERATGIEPVSLAWKAGDQTANNFTISNT